VFSVYLEVVGFDVWFWTLKKNRQRNPRVLINKSFVANPQPSEAITGASSPTANEERGAAEGGKRIAKQSGWQGGGKATLRTGTRKKEQPAAIPLDFDNQQKTQRSTENPEPAPVGNVQTRSAQVI